MYTIEPSFWENHPRLAPIYKPLTEEERQKRDAELNAYQEKLDRITAIFVENKDNLTLAIGLFCKEKKLDFEDIHSFAIDNILNPKSIVNEVVNRIDLKIETSKETESLEKREERLMQYFTTLDALSTDINHIHKAIESFYQNIVPDAFDVLDTESQEILSIEKSKLPKLLKLAAEIISSHGRMHFNNSPDLFDEDQNSVRRNLFDFSRVKKYLKTLNDDLERSNYLVEIRDAFIEQLDLPESKRRGAVRYSDKTIFRHSKGFLKEIIQLLDSLREKIAARERHNLTTLVSQNVSKSFAKLNSIDDKNKDSFDKDNQAKNILSKNVIARNKKQVFLALRCLFRLEKTNGSQIQNAKLVS
jgi:hypothetical protein